MTSQYHQDILEEIKKNSGTPTEHTFLNSYLGTDHPRYPINSTAMRAIAKAWMKKHPDLPAHEFESLLTSLIEGKSFNEKTMVGALMDAALKEQRAINPKVFDHWLDHVQGWAEVDMLCTNKYSVTQLPIDWKKWVPILKRFAKDKNIHKRRASLVLLCSPLRHVDDEALLEMALANVLTLKNEKHVLITKAISWALRSAVKYHKKQVAAFIKENKDELPSIAVRETLAVLKTGKKTKSKERK